jgi:outer membrane protein
MKKFFGVAVLVTGIFLQQGFAQDSAMSNHLLTLQQCVETAIKNNAAVNRAGFQSESNEVNLQQAKGNRLPFVNGAIYHGINQGRSIDPFSNGYINQNISFANYGLNASISVWNGAAIRNSIQQNLLTFEAGKMDWQQEKDNITINVILAYLSVLNNQELLNASIKQVAVTRQQAERLDLLNKDGAIAPATYYDVKGQLASDEINVVNSRNTLATSKLDLAQHMNIAYDKNMELQKISESLTPVLYDATVDMIYEQALQQLAFVKAADLRKQSAASGVKAAKGSLTPTLSLNGSLGTNYSSAASLQKLLSTTEAQTDSYVLNGASKLPVIAPQGNYETQKITYGNQWTNNFNSSISLSLQIPILNGLQAKSRLKQAKITEKQTTFEANTTKIQLRQNIEQAYLNMSAALDRYTQLQMQVQDFTESFRSAEVRFNAGAATVVDYIIAKNNMDRATINLIAAKYDYVLRTKVLDFYQGKLSY